jgi:hypothetical protein
MKQRPGFRATQEQFDWLEDARKAAGETSISEWLRDLAAQAGEELLKRKFPARKLVESTRKKR